MSSFNFNPLSNMHLIPPNGSGFMPKMMAKPSTQHHYGSNPGTSGNMDLENTSESICEHHNDDNGASNSELMMGMMGIQPQSFMMLMDPSLLGIQQFPMLNLPQQVTSPENPSKSNELNSIVKETIHCPSCTLQPPSPHQPAPTTRERPLGCKTCFIGGLPENITKEIIFEIFERCGEITTLRLSKKNFCHIRFTFEASVDSAIYLSGYRVKIGNSNDPANSGKLHVDYAQARDDQYDYECRLRQLQREQRHKEKDRVRSSTSPPLIVHFTDHEATALSEKIKNDETFLKAVQTLIIWLERGDCTKKNANIFYSMIQSTNSHIRRLLNEKCQYEDELREAKEKYHKQMTKMTEQFNQIEKVFNAASHKNQKVWDHFTKAQRKNLDNWRKQTVELKTFQHDDSVDDTDEMDMSDDDFNGSSNKKARIEKPKKKDDESQYETKLEVDLRDSRSDSDMRNKQIKVLQETIQNLQRKLIETNAKEKQSETKISELEETLRESNVKELLLRTKIANARTFSQSVTTDDASETSSLAPVNHTEINNNEPQLISFATAYLVIHPRGAGFDALLNYIEQFLPTNASELQETLARNEKLFVSDESGKKWFFGGFKRSSTSLTC